MAIIKKIFRKKISKINSGIINNKVDIMMPNYMNINDRDKEKLIYNISLMQKFLLEEKTKLKEKEENELITIIKDKYDIKLSDITNLKKLELAIKDLSFDEKKELINKYNTISKNEKVLTNCIDEIIKVIDEINKKNISIIVENDIQNEISNIINNKNLEMDIVEKISNFIQNVIENINNLDNIFLKDVIKEYNKVNYITIATKIIDDSYEKLKKMTNDFQNHRYNKYYYEREISKIKHELKEIQDLKLDKDVSLNIANLKKELYTKSKDKYDILYNNEIFVNYNLECDILLDRINAKVIDINNKEDDSKKEEHFDNIIYRFQDLAVARKLILLAQVEDNKLVNDNQIDFVHRILKKRNKITENFHFTKNKKKAELVILFNELNMVISKKRGEAFLSIDHINFRMKDLEEAVRVKREEVKKIYNIDDN